MFVRVTVLATLLAVWRAGARTPSGGTAVGEEVTESAATLQAGAPGAAVGTTADHGEAESSVLLQVKAPGATLIADQVHLCSMDPRAEEHLADVLRRVAGSEFTQPLETAWRAYQAKVAEEAERDHPSPSRKLRVLIVLPVRSAMLETVAFNMEQLSRTGAGDVFKLALFHYDVDEGRQPSTDSGQMSALLPHIAFYRSGPGCKAQFWRQITPEVAHGFDYLWLLDGDLRMDYFDWTIYRQVLFQVDPLVSQPSILAWAPGKRSTRWLDLRMRRPGANGTMARFWEPLTVEIMAPLLSAKIWPAMHLRLGTVDGRRAGGVQRVIHKIAKLAKQSGCRRTAELVVNLSPLRHADCHDLMSKGPECSGGWVHGDCHNITVAEADALVRDLGGGRGSGCGRDVWEGVAIGGC